MCWQPVVLPLELAPLPLLRGDLFALFEQCLEKILQKALHIFFFGKIIRSWYRMILPLELVMPVAIGADGNIFGGIELVKRTKCTKTFRSSLLSGSGWDPVILPLELAALAGGTNLRGGCAFQLGQTWCRAGEKFSGWENVNWICDKTITTCESVLRHQDYHH